MTRLKAWGAGLLLAMSACLPVMAQQTGISGRVTDPSGAIVAGANVTATGEDGSKFSTTTNNLGVYQFPALRAASYTLRFEAPGFAPAERTLTVLVGQVASIDAKLNLATTSSAVNVEAAAVAVDTSSSTVAGDVSPTEVKKLPLNGRNYLQLAMMVPGITSNDVTNSPLGATDSGKIQINVDGQQVTQNAAADSFGEPQYSQDAIDQFQIITNRFDATQGRSSRVQVNVQTKSGTDQFHGTLYGYFRNSEFNASDSVAHKVLPFSDQQFGGTVGGPILRNKLFFFFAYEGERQPNTVFDTPTGFAGESFSFANQLRTNSYLLRTDYQVSNSHRISVRGTGYTWAVPFNNVTGTASPTRATDSTRTSYAVLATWTWIVSPSMVNELKGGLNHFDWLNTPLVNSQEYDLPGGITVGGPYNYPQHFIQNTQQYRDDMYLLHNGHSVKVGGEYLRTKYSGIFQQNIRGKATSFSSGVSSLNYDAIFPTWNDPSTWNIAALNPYVISFVQGFGNFNINIPTNAFAGWIQDDWKLNPKLTFNIGVRYDNDLGIFDPTLRLKSGIQTPDYNDNLMFQPRLGFAYDPLGDRKTVIRGGAGIFRADIQANQVIDQQIFNGQSSLQPSVQVGVNGVTGINLTAPFGSTTAAQFLSGAVPINAQAIQPLGPTIRTPYSLQMSLGVERQISKTWTASVDYVHWRVYHDWIRQDANEIYNPVTGYNLKGKVQNSSFTTINQFITPDAAGSQYDGLQVSIQHRFSQNISASAAYTLSRLKDSTTGAFYYPNNQFDVANEWANSPDDQRNTLTVAGSYLWKWGISLSGSFHYGSGQAYQVTATGNPFSSTVQTDRIFAATARYYGSGSNVQQVVVAGIPYNLVARDSFYGLPIERVDLRLSKTFNVKERFRFIPIVEAFNLFNHANFGAYNTVVTAASYGLPAQNTDLAYAARMLQFAGRFEF